MEENITRNQELFEKKEKGATYRQLAIDYNLSMQAVFVIVKRMRQRKIIHN